MTKQYLRKFSCILGSQFAASQQTQAQGESGTTTTFATQAPALDFSKFKVKFQIRRGDKQTPNSADVRIYNLSDQTANRVKGEFSQILIQAGYEGNYGLLFAGSVVQVRKGRENQTDTYVDITAADGDEAYNYSVSAFTMGAGSKPADAVAALLKDMVRGGISQGYSPPLSTNGSVRGRVFYGATRDELRRFANANGVLWSIQDGKLTLIPKTNFVPGSTPIISPQTGMIGVPEQTQNGLKIRTLINPLLKIGQRIQLKSKNVNQLRYGLDSLSQGQNLRLATSIKLNNDGFYYVLQANHSGDTRGNEWYTDLTCLAVDATVLTDSAIVQSTAPNADVVQVIPQT